MKVRMKEDIYIILRSWEEKKIGSWWIDFNARFYELNLEKGKETLEMFLVNNLSYKYCTYTKDWKRIMIVYRLHGDLLARRGGGLVPKKKSPKNGWKLGNNETHWCVWLKTAGTRWNGSAWRVEVEEGTWRAITVPVMPLRNCVFLRAYRAIFRESPANAFHLNKCLGLTTFPLPPLFNSKLNTCYLYS